MSKYLEASKSVSDLICAIEDRFNITVDDIELGLDDAVGLIFMVERNVGYLANFGFSDTDFNLFCKSHDLDGVIFFNKSGTVTFSMTPKIS